MFSPSDAFIYIPLIVTAITIIGILAVLAVAAARKIYRISFIFYVSLGLILVGILFMIITQNQLALPVSLLLAATLFSPYVIVKLLSNPKKQSEDAISLGEAKDLKHFNVIAEEQDISVLEIQRDFLDSAVDNISIPDGLTRVFDHYAQKAIEISAADGAMILILEEFEDILSVKNIRGLFIPPYLLPENVPHKQNRVEMSMKYAQFPLRGNIFGEVISNAYSIGNEAAELVTEPLKDKRIKQNGKEDFLKCGSYIFVPLIVKSRVFGLLALSRASAREAFSETELEAAKNIASIMAIGAHIIVSHSDMVERSKSGKESEIATRIQKSLIPARLPILPGIEVGLVFEQAQAVCGDFFDFVAARKDRLAFVSADVTGKGMTSLVIMIKIRSMLRLVINTTQTPATILDWTNRGLQSEEDAADQFASVSLIFYDSTTNEITFSSGGTNPIYINRVSGTKLEKISDDCMPVGMEKDTEFKDKKIQCDTGDIIVTCSDGLIEALDTNGNQYSASRLEKVVLANRALSGREIAAKVKSDIKDFCGGEAQHDDFSLLVLKIQ